MATLAQMDRLVGRAMFDGEFRARLLKDPESAVKTLRIKLTAGQLERLAGLDAEVLERLGAEFEDLVDQQADQSFSFW
jgi:hypothetical protein